MWWSMGIWNFFMGKHLWNIGLSNDYHPKHLIIPWKYWIIHWNIRIFYRFPVIFPWISRRLRRLGTDFLMTPEPSASMVSKSSRCAKRSPGNGSKSVSFGTWIDISDGIYIYWCIYIYGQCIYILYIGVCIYIYKHIYIETVSNHVKSICGDY